MSELRDNATGAVEGKSLVLDSSSCMIPIAATWYITRNCQYRCRDCYSVTSDLLLLDDELDHSSACLIVDELFDNGVFLLKFAGGEPTLKKNFFSLSRYARSVGMSIQVSTNGMSICEVGATKFSEVGYKAIQISLDDLDEYINDGIRGAGSYRIALDAIAKCNEIGLAVILAYSIRDSNVAHLDELLKFCKKHRLAALKLQPVAGSINWSRNEEFILNKKYFLEESLKINVSCLVPDSQVHVTSAPKELIILPNGSLTKSHFCQKEARYKIIDLGVGVAWNKLTQDVFVKNGSVS